jgi:enoyl-CoA hydratase
MTVISAWAGTALSVLRENGDHGWQATLEDGVLHLVLSRPPVNAIDTMSWRRLHDCLERIRDDETVRSLVISSDNSKVFCAGQDYNDVRGDDGSAFGGPGDRRRAVFEAHAAIYRAHVPTVVAARGAAIGSGACLAGLADLVVGGPGTKMWLPEVDRGIIGGSRFLARLLPEPMMRKMILLGTKVSGEELHRVGALAEYVPDDEVVETALGLGQQLAAKNPVVMRIMKQANVEVEYMPVMDGYSIEQKYSVIVPHSVRQELVPKPVTPR